MELEFNSDKKVCNVGLLELYLLLADDFDVPKLDVLLHELT